MTAFIGSILVVGGFGLFIASATLVALAREHRSQKFAPWQRLGRWDDSLYTNRGRAMIDRAFAGFLIGFVLVAVGVAVLL